MQGQQDFLPMTYALTDPDLHSVFTFREDGSEVTLLDFIRAKAPPERLTELGVDPAPGTLSPIKDRGALTDSELAQLERDPCWVHRALRHVVMEPQYSELLKQKARFSQGLPPNRKLRMWAMMHADMLKTAVTDGHFRFV